MSATNHTVTVELSQYVSTDKPTYLTDYNGDMLKIDNAIAADRDSISGVSIIANRADGKADTNKTNIDALNVQLNGDPEDPTDVGIAGDLNAVEGTVNTVTSLIGSGSPTTSDQTIIGAINGLEGSVAPREDSATFANSYAIGAKFARGGSVYEALVSLSAGTAFASLVLNTDYKVADTLVKQIEDAASGSGVISGIVNSVEESIAPREDGTTLADSYSVGDQFIRAGVLYEALTSLTAGDTFASLVLNTDYKVADTLVEQIEDAASGVLPTGYYIKNKEASVSVTANGFRYLSQVLEDLRDELLTALSALADDEYIVLNKITRSSRVDYTFYAEIKDWLGNDTVIPNSEGFKFSRCDLSTINAKFGLVTFYGNTVNANTATIESGSATFTNIGTETPAEGAVFTLIYDVYKAF